MDVVVDAMGRLNCTEASGEGPVSVSDGTAWSLGRGPRSRTRSLAKHNRVLVTGRLDQRS